MNERLLKKLLKRKELGNFRSLHIPEAGIDFFSNDYLGLSKVAISNAQLGYNGSTGSRLLSGNSSIAEECESILAAHFNAESALVFGSGYVANLGLLSAVLQRGDLVFYDQYIHASSRDGIRLSMADSVSFKHNDVLDLRNKLANSKSKCNYVLIESLYSMDGDLAPLIEIASICDEHDAYLIVDEAHACGVYGSMGKGLCYQKNVLSKIFARIITFGKAYGSHGAAVLGAESLKAYLVNFSRSFIYSTALPPSNYRDISQLVRLQELNQLRSDLTSNVSYFRKLCDSLSFLSDTTSPIQILEYPNAVELEEVVSRLKDHAIYTKGIYPPTVPEGKSRLRLCIHAFNTKEEIEVLATCLQS
jgi:8-amino-7-oxononanoate synthase